MNKTFRSYMLSCTAVLAVAPALASAQATEEGEAPDSAESTASREILVTGSRIVRDGYTAPTPVNVLSADDISAIKPANLVDLVNQIPAITQGGSTVVNSANFISSGNAGISSMNLRGLGQSRTLVLLDGQRSVPSSFQGLVDVNNFPQDLVERVEIVTGGASAQYGSDAVGGVVNYILDKQFRGLKLASDAGITNYGDGLNYRVSATAGASFVDDRLHVLLNGEYFKQESIDSVDRPWNSSGTFRIFNPAYVLGNGQPEFLVGAGIGPSRFTAGGLVNSGPLRGTYFLTPGVTHQLNYGTISGLYMIGGDWRVTLDGAEDTAQMMPEVERTGVFGRMAFDITDSINVYGQVSWNRSELRGLWRSPQLTFDIRSDNGFLLTQFPAVAAAMQANGLSSINIGSHGAGFPTAGTSNLRNVYRYVIGADGNLPVFGGDWSWRAYYQNGVAKNDIETIAALNNARLALAQDAVLANGRIVCRSTLTNPNNGCVPVNRLGTDGPSAAALAYIYGPAQPRREDTMKQEVASLIFNGDLFNLPAGPLAVAFGGEWRRESADARVPDPIFRSGWFVGNFRPFHGEQNVKEAFLEADIPVIAGLSVNPAVRYTDYSTVGSVQTWKVGATYSPISDFRVRATVSRDIRAPNLLELFDTGTAATRPIILPANSPSPGQVIIVERSIGNPDLEPERANTWTAGIVLTPGLLPGFSASFDYFNIKVNGGIGSVGLQQIVDFCFTGRTQFCNALVFSGNELQSAFNQPFNFSRQRVKGFDVEASYLAELSSIAPSFSGRLRVHASATHYVSNVVDNGVFPVELAGANGLAADTYGQGTPKWRYRVTASYDLHPATVTLVGRGFSSTVYGNHWIQCTSNCHVSTIENPTANVNHAPGAFYLDGSLGFEIRKNASITFIVQNLFDKDPPILGVIGPSTGSLGHPQTNVNLYDILGRTLRIAARMKF